MKKFLIDANLPYYFGLWNNDTFIHQNDIDPKASDISIWKYAKSNNLTIITKDSDFSNRILISKPPPKVIHIRLGNLKMKAFYNIIQKNWNEILKMNSDYKLVNVYMNEIEGVE